MKKMALLSAIMLMGVPLNVIAQNELDNSGTLIIPAVYDKIEAGVDGMFIVSKGQKKGVIDSNGKVVVPVQYDYVNLGNVYQNCGGLIVVANEVETRSDEGRLNIYGLYNKNGVLLAPMDKYDFIEIQNMYGYEGLAEVSVVESIENDTLTDFETNRYTIKKRRVTKKGVLLQDGVLLASYDWMTVNRGLIVVEKNNKKGVLNRIGEIIIPIKYEDITIDDGKLIRVGTPYQNGGRKYGIYNDKGEVVVPIGKYESVDINNNYIVVKKGGKKGVLNRKGIEIVPIGKYEDCYISECYERRQYYVEVKSNKKKGAVNENGKAFIPIGKYEDFRILNPNIALVKMKGKNAIVDKKGVVVVPFGKYEELSYRHGILAYLQKGKWGIISESGNQATPAEFDNIEAARHSRGMALVRKDGKIGVVDCNGHLVIPFGEYNNGAIIGNVGFLKSEEGTMLFNCDGKILAPIGKYEKCQQEYGQLKGYDLNKWPIPVNPNKSDEGLYVITSNGKKGVVKLW